MRSSPKIRAGKLAARNPELRTPDLRTGLERLPSQAGGRLRGVLREVGRGAQACAEIQDIEGGKNRRGGLCSGPGGCWWRSWRGNSGPDARAWCHVKEADMALFRVGSQVCEAGSVS